MERMELPIGAGLEEHHGRFFRAEASNIVSV